MKKPYFKNTHVTRWRTSLKCSISSGLLCSAVLFSLPCTVALVLLINTENASYSATHSGGTLNEDDGRQLAQLTFSCF